jgi:hypothetical protein
LLVLCISVDLFDPVTTFDLSLHTTATKLKRLYHGSLRECLWHTCTFVSDTQYNTRTSVKQLPPVVRPTQAAQLSQIRETADHCVSMQQARGLRTCTLFFVFSSYRSGTALLEGRNLYYTRGSWNPTPHRFSLPSRLTAAANQRHSLKHVRSANQRMDGGRQGSHDAPSHGFQVPCPVQSAAVYWAGAAKDREGQQADGSCSRCV